MRTGEIQTSQLINRLIAFPHNTISIAFCFSCKCKRSQYTFGENQNWIPFQYWKIGNVKANCKHTLANNEGQRGRHFPFLALTTILFFFVLPFLDSPLPHHIDDSNLSRIYHSAHILSSSVHIHIYIHVYIHVHGRYTVYHQVQFQLTIIV